MKLAAKFTTLLILGIAIMLGVDAWLAVHRNIQMMDEDARRDALRYGRHLGPIVEEFWREGGQERVESFLDNLNEGQPAGQLTLGEFTQIRWVYLDTTDSGPRKPMASRQELEPVLAGDRHSIEHLEQGRSYMLTYCQIAVADDRGVAALEVAEPLTHSDDIMQQFVVRLLVLTGITMLFGIAMVILLGRELVARPLRLLLAKTRRIGRGDLTGPVRLRRRDEFGELALAINTMCDDLSGAREQVAMESAARMEAQEQLRHADRLRTIGRLASGVAHEIGTPLNVISGRAEMLTDPDLPAAETEKCARVIRAESERITGIVRNLLDFARRNTPDRASHDVARLVRQTVDSLQPLAEKNRIQIRQTGEPGPLSGKVDPAQFRQVLTNLVVNGVQAMPEGGELEIRLSREHRWSPDPQPGSGPRNWIRMDVHDEGSGIRPDDLNQLFEPFFTTKDVGEGTGLGLSIAHGIAQEHGGWIDVQSELGKGSCFTVYLPLEENE